MNEKVGAVIVAFNPDSALFFKVIEKVVEQVDVLVIVNNSDDRFDMDLSGDCEKIHVIENGRNIGIAAAQNSGINKLIELGCEFFLILDHDSVIPESMVEILLKNFVALSTTDKKLVAIGPTYYNARLNKVAPFVRFGWFRLKYLTPREGEGLFPVDFIISSGTLLSKESLRLVGLMDEGLFIDYVDTEWCIRARSLGHNIYGCGEVVMRHSLGDEPLVFLNKVRPNHSPIRHYYIIRNAILLLGRSYIPLKVKLIIFLSMVKTFIFYSLVPSNRSVHFFKMLKGAFHGFSGRFGKY